MKNKYSNKKNKKKKENLAGDSVDKILRYSRNNPKKEETVTITSEQEIVITGQKNSILG